MSVIHAQLHRLSVLLVSSCACLSGCATYVGSAANAYSQGRYLEVAEQLGEREAEMPRLNAEQRATYGLYRGLALIRLREPEAAARWLSYAEALESRHPGTLESHDRQSLLVGLSEIQQKPVTRRAPSTDEVASKVLGRNGRLDAARVSLE